MLLLSNEEIDGLVTMPECMDALEALYSDLDAGRALGSPRVDNISPSAVPDAYYAFKQMGGTWPARGIQVLRINSDVVAHPVVDGKPRRVKVPAADGRWVGLVALFSTETGELLAMFPDGVAQRLRVGAASGLAARRLAREDAASLALIGSGWQAGAQLMALRSVRRLARVTVYSPNAERREAFVAQARAEGIDAVAAPDVATCVKGADIIASATSAMAPTIEAGWLRPGVHAGCLKPQEVDADVLRACDRVVVHTHDQSKHVQNVMPGTPHLSAESSARWWRDPAVGASSLPDLASLVSGRTPGRQSADEITLFVNNMGIGLQFAALGALILDKARAAGIGRRFPREWFTESVHP